MITDANAASTSKAPDETQPEQVIPTNRKRVLPSPDVKCQSSSEAHLFDVLTTANSLKRSAAMPNRVSRPQRFKVMRQPKTNTLVEFPLYNDSEIGMDAKFVQEN